jgi:hypothetical protein
VKNRLILIGLLITVVAVIMIGVAFYSYLYNEYKNRIHVNVSYIVEVSDSTMKNSP